MVQARQYLANILIHINALEFLLVKIVNHDLWSTILFAIQRKEVLENVELRDDEVLVAKPGQKILPFAERNAFANLTVGQSCEFVVLVLVCGNCDKEVPQVIHVHSDIFLPVDDFCRCEGVCGLGCFF